MSNVAAGKDTDADGAKLNDVEKVLSKLDIKLRNSKKEWRSFEEVIDEVASKWKDFGDTERSQIATAIAGTRQQETFRALMNNYDMVNNLTKTAEESTGSASEKMNVYLDSVEAKTKELQATWEEFVMSLSQSDSYKAFLDICEWALKNIPTIIGYLTSLVVIFKGKTILEKIDKLNAGTSGLLGVFGQLKQNLSILRNGWYRNAEGMLQVATAAETAQATLSLLTGGIGLLIAALTAGIQIYNSWKQANVEAANKAKEEADSYEKKASAMDDAKEKYTEIYNSSKDYNTKQAELKTLSDELTSSYGEEAKALDLLNGKYEENIQKMEAAANAKRKQELASLKTASEKGESNLDNWTNLYNDVDYTGDKIDLNDKNKKALQDIKNLAGDKTHLITGNYYHSEFGNGHYVGTDDVNNASSIIGLRMNNTATNEEGLKTAQNLQEYLDKNAGELDQSIIDMVTGFINQIKSEVDKDASGQYDNKQKYQLAKATQNDDGSLKSEITDYEAQLKKQQELEKKYTEETDKDKKEQLEKELAEEYKTTEEALNKVKGLYNKDDSNQSTLSEKTLLDYLGFGEDNTSKVQSNIYAGLDDNQKNTYEAIKKELKDTGKLSEEAKQKLAELRQQVSKKEDGDNWLKSLDNDLGEIANKSKINLQKENLSSEYNAIEDKSYENVGRWLNGVNASLSDLGLNVDAKWYKDLSEGLKNGTVDFEKFYNTVSAQCKKLGIDLDDLTKKLDNTKDTPAILGSQSDFVGEMDEIDDLYDKAAKIKSGKSIDNDDMVELRNKYKELNNYIAETGDLTLKNGKLLTEIANSTYEGGEKALEGQITALENYQDAILNTVDAMGIMADFKEELAKLDADEEDSALRLAGTITDTAVESAKAKGMFVDIASASADGVYDSDETVTMGEQNLLTAAQATAQGIFDSKETEMEIAQNMADASIDANTAIQDSEAATAEQKTQAAQMAGDAKAAEAEIAAGAAETEATAEGSSAEASAKGSEAKADSQSIAASAAITTGQAFLQMAQAIAQAEGVETSGLTDAGNKLQDLQGQLDSLNADKSSNAAKAAAAYKEAQAKIQEAKARLNSYKNANKTGKSNYDAAKKSGSSGSKNNYSADDAASDLKDILNDIEKYEEEIELDLEDQTEQFINQEMLAANRLDTLKNELDYYNEIYDVTENTSKWLETQNKLLDNQSKKVGNLQNATASIEAQRKKLIDQNSQYNVSSWFDSEGNDTLAYGDLINSFEYQKEAIERETARKMREVYNSVAGSTSKDAISSAKDKIKQIEDEGDIRIKALKKEQSKIENIHESVSQLNDAWKKNQDAIRDALKELHDLVKSIRDELLNDITEQLEKAVDRANKSLEKSVTRMEQLVTIQEKYNDILNECIDTQDELDNELQSSLDSFEYLDEQMRELMFNEKDYKVLSDTLEGIQEDIANIWEDHYNQIDELTDDTMYKAEYITSETERQLDMKMKEYELAKAELDVAKARTNLQNVQNERNVRMFVGGQWIWTADPNAVKDAQQQLADAERAKNKVEREAEQKKLLDRMNQMIDADNLQINENNELLERIQDAIEDQTTEIKSIEDALANASGEDLPALNDVLSGAFGKDGGDFKTIMANLNKGQTELAAALDGKTTAQAESQLKSNNMSKSDFESLVKRLGYGWDEKTGTVTTWDGSFKAHYQGWRDTSSTNTPLGTGSNGASVTGGNSGSSSSAASSGGGGNNTGGFPKSGKVSTSSLPLRIRSGAGTNYRVLGTMPRGASVTITGEAGNGWAKVSYNGINGYASKQYLTYDQGGLAQGKGIFLKDVNVPERVLSPKQTKSFDTLVKNLTTNPVLAALTKDVKGTSNLNGLMGGSGETKQYYFSNFTVKSDNLTEFIDSLEGMIPIANK